MLRSLALRLSRPALLRPTVRSTLTQLNRPVTLRETRRFASFKMSETEVTPNQADKPMSKEDFRFFNQLADKMDMFVR